MGDFWKRTERAKWAASGYQVNAHQGVDLARLGDGGSDLYGRRLPRNVRMARPAPDRPGVNYWMAPEDVMHMRWRRGDVVLGKLGPVAIGHRDDRPMVTFAGSRGGKTTTALKPNLYVYEGPMLVVDPKGELARTTALARARMGHLVYVLDPFGQARLGSASFNLLSELDPEADTIIDDIATLTQAIIVDEGDSRSQHWNNSARTYLQGLILFTLTLPQEERTLITVRQLMSLTHPGLRAAVKVPGPSADGPPDEVFFQKNRVLLETLLMAMASSGERFGGILAAIGERFLATPPSERGSILSTAAVQTDFLDSLPLRAISRRSDFHLASLAGDRPVTIYLCLPMRMMGSHFRWLRMIIQQACTTLEKLGTWPREKTPILFMLEEFATLGHMEIMERAAAYMPGFGVKLWAILQDTTQLRRYYQNGWETFLGNAGIVQCFANSDQATLDYLARRMEGLIRPFELRTAFSRESHAQLLLMEGRDPVAAMRLTHEDVEGLRLRTSALFDTRALPRS